MKEWPFKDYAVSWILVLAIAFSLLYLDCLNNIIAVVLCGIVMLSILLKIGECNGSDDYYKSYSFIIFLAVAISSVVVLPISAVVIMAIVLVPLWLLSKDVFGDGSYSILFAIISIQIIVTNSNFNAGSCVIGSILASLVIIYSMFQENRDMSILAVPLFCLPHIVSRII